MGFPTSISPKTQLYLLERKMQECSSLCSPYSPNVNSGGVLPQLKQKLRWTVPSCDHQASVVSSPLTHGPSSFRHRSVVVPGQTEIGNLENSLVADEEVGGLHISVKNVVVVEVSKALEEL